MTGNGLPWPARATCHHGDAYACMRSGSAGQARDKLLRSGSNRELCDCLCFDIAHEHGHPRTAASSSAVGHRFVADGTARTDRVAVGRVLTDALLERQSAAEKNVSMSDQQLGLRSCSPQQRRDIALMRSTGTLACTYDAGFRPSERPLTRGVT